MGSFTIIVLLVSLQKVENYFLKSPDYLKKIKRQINLRLKLHPRLENNHNTDKKSHF